MASSTHWNDQETHGERTNRYHMAVLQKGTRSFGKWSLYLISSAKGGFGVQ